MIYSDIVQTLTLVVLVVGLGKYWQSCVQLVARESEKQKNSVGGKVEILKGGLHHHWTFEGSPDHLEAVDHPELEVRVVRGKN